MSATMSWVGRRQEGNGWVEGTENMGEEINAHMF
jgi:hypothetical protein